MDCIHWALISFVFGLCFPKICLCCIRAFGFSSDGITRNSVAADYQRSQFRKSGLGPHLLDHWDHEPLGPVSGKNFQIFRFPLIKNLKMTVSESYQWRIQRRLTGRGFDRII